mgnify:CR=1 FL=1
MSVEAFRLQNFMPFEDTGWIELRPICLLFGRNSSGKSAIIRALRFLRQSLNDQATASPFTYYTDYGVDVGDYPTVIHHHEPERGLSFSFRCTVEDTIEQIRELVNLQRGHNHLVEITAEDFAAWVEIELTYGQGDVDTKVQLKEFKIVGPWGVSDGTEKCTIFEAQRLPLASVSFEEQWWFRSDVLFGHEHENETAWEGVSIELVNGFLPALEVPPLAVEEDSLSLRDRKLVNTLLHALCKDIAAFLRGFEYLGPIRPQPQRVYAFDPLARLRWEEMGWGTFLRFLKGEVDEDLMGQITSWMKKLDLGYKVLSDKENYAGDSAIVAQVKIQNADGVQVNLVDTGYGANQVLPIIIQCLLAEREALVIIEQPELHLHPRAQAQLADLLIEVATRGEQLAEQRKAAGQSLPTQTELKSLRVRFLIETHSEHILLRLRRHIVEETLSITQIQKDVQPTAAGELLGLDEEQLRAYFVEFSDSKSSVEPILINRLGQYEKQPSGFRRFFSDDYDQVMAITERLSQLMALEHENEHENASDD